MNHTQSDQLLTKASGFLEAARAVVDAKGSKSSVRAPVAHLIAHALELLMKHVLVSKGHDLDAVRADFGHDLRKLWECDEMSAFKVDAGVAAKAANLRAKYTQEYQDEFSEDPVALFGCCVQHLSRLHTKKSNFALRYMHEPEETVPPLLFLLDTLQSVKDDLAKAYFRDVGA